MWWRMVSNCVNPGLTPSSDRQDRMARETDPGTILINSQQIPLAVREACASKECVMDEEAATAGPNAFVDRLGTPEGTAVSGASRDASSTISQPSSAHGSRSAFVVGGHVAGRGLRPDKNTTVGLPLSQASVETLSERGLDSFAMAMLVADMAETERRCALTPRPSSSPEIVDRTHETLERVDGLMSLPELEEDHLIRSQLCQRAITLMASLNPMRSALSTVYSEKDGAGWLDVGEVVMGSSTGHPMGGYTPSLSTMDVADGLPGDVDVQLLVITVNLRGVLLETLRAG